MREESACGECPDDERDDAGHCEHDHADTEECDACNWQEAEHHSYSYERCDGCDSRGADLGAYTATLYGYPRPFAFDRRTIANAIINTRAKSVQPDGHPWYWDAVAARDMVRAVRDGRSH